MQLTARAILRIKECCPSIKSKLALALSCSEASINRYLRDNSDNLTKAAALAVISKETGLRTSDLLEVSKAN